MLQWYPKLPAVWKVNWGRRAVKLFRPGMLKLNAAVSEVTVCVKFPKLRPHETAPETITVTLFGLNWHAVSAEVKHRPSSLTDTKALV